MTYPFNSLKTLQMGGVADHARAKIEERRTAILQLAKALIYFKPSAILGNVPKVIL